MNMGITFLPAILASYSALILLTYNVSLFFREFIHTHCFFKNTQVKQNTYWFCFQRNAALGTVPNIICPGVITCMKDSRTVILCCVWLETGYSTGFGFI